MAILVLYIDYFLILLMDSKTEAKTKIGQKFSIILEDGSYFFFNILSEAVRTVLQQQTVSNKDTSPYIVTPYLTDTEYIK